MSSVSFFWASMRAQVASVTLSAWLATVSSDLVELVLVGNELVGGLPPGHRRLRTPTPPLRPRRSSRPPLAFWPASYWAPSLSIRSEAEFFMPMFAFAKIPARDLARRQRLGPKLYRLGGPVRSPHQGERQLLTDATPRSSSSPVQLRVLDFVPLGRCRSSSVNRDVGGVLHLPQLGRACSRMGIMSAPFSRRRRGGSGFSLRDPQSRCRRRRLNRGLEVDTAVGGVADHDA